MMESLKFYNRSHFVEKIKFFDWFLQNFSSLLFVSSNTFKYISGLKGDAALFVPHELRKLKLEIFCRTAFD